MSPLSCVVLCLGAMLPGQSPEGPVPGVTDCALMREKLLDRDNPREQSQAALWLVQCNFPEAKEIIHQGLRHTESFEVFLSLASALRLSSDRRYNAELLEAMVGGPQPVRQGAAEALAFLADDSVISRLQKLADDAKTAMTIRETAVWTLGRSGRKTAANFLMKLLSSEQEPLQPALLKALADLTGQSLGENVVSWKHWWENHKDSSNERWLEDRLAYQGSRASRLDEELQRTRAQVVRLHQQLYARLPPADRLGQIQSLADQEDFALRTLAVAWSLEVLPSADAVGQRALTDLLLRLSRDASLEVQRPAVLALGHLQDPRAFGRLEEILHEGLPSVRAAAARSLTQRAMKELQKEESSTKIVGQGTGSLSPEKSGPKPIPAPPANPQAPVIRSKVVAALQKALEDPALEVVLEAAEDLGTLGVPEAGPVLVALLHHPSEPVRQTAAQALERVADPKVLDGLLAALDDSSVTVRFSLIGALGHLFGAGQPLDESDRNRLLQHLQNLLVHDPDPGVRSRAATLLGECGSPEILPVLWQRTLASEDTRVQDKAWASMAAILVRGSNLELLNDWDHRVAEAGQNARRLFLLGAVGEGWKKNEATRTLAGNAKENLIQAQLDQGQWSAAFPLVRDLLNQAGSDAEVDKRLHWFWIIGFQALRDGNPTETLRVVHEAQPFLARTKLTAEFERLEKEARQSLLAFPQTH